MNCFLKISDPGLMPINFLKGLLFIIILSTNANLLSATSTPQNDGIIFSSDSIQGLFNLLPDEIKSEVIYLNDFPVKSHSILNTKYQGDTIQLNIRYNKYGELAHLGIHIFNIESDHLFYTKVFEFVEREILRYLILKEDYKILARMKLTEITLYLNGEEYQKNHYSSILSICSLLKDAPFTLNANDDDYSVSWKLNSIEYLTIQFPNNYLIISGKRKDEIEKEIGRDLKAVAADYFHYEANIENEINCYRDIIIIKEGEPYDGSEEILSDTYYEIDSITPVFDTVNIKESLSNLFLNVTTSKKALNINHHLYGDMEDQFKININDFFNYFLSEHRFYCGVRDSLKNDIQANIFIYNVPFRYVHLLTIRTNMTEVFDNESNIDGMLYTFIRKDNIK